jgi:alkylation response protein AidB-like acyl-CoA dehydrogenase
MSVIDTNVVARVRAAAEAIAPLSAAIERARRLTPEALAALVDAGAFKLLVPRAYGGAEASFATFVTAIEEIARGDGSSGWCAMVGASSGLMSAFVDDDVARDVYAASDAAVCGVFAPMGRARPDGDGYRVSGRWSFASGCEHSQWRMGGVLVTDGDAPRVMSVLLRASETEVHDTWDTSGLRGTGSHDIEAKDVLVPKSRCFSLVGQKPRFEGGVYALTFGVLASGVAAVAIGVARRAVSEIVTLAKAKHPQMAKRTLAHRELVQLDVARAEAKVRAARALLHAAIDETEREVASRGEASVTSRAHLRLAAAHAVSESAAAASIAYEAGGGTSLYATSPLQRCFRDAHTITQHVMVSATTTTLVGRVLLDVETDLSLL